MIKEPYCASCKHFFYDDEKGAMCTAFAELKKWHSNQLVPSCIPPEIYSGTNKHIDPFPGDCGIRFEKKDI